MRFNQIAAVGFAATAAAAPLEVRQTTVTDADILQYALTLEHLENVFYKQAVSTFSQAAWVSGGGTAESYNNIKYIAHDEESHVQYLTAGLTAAGAKPVAACSYAFPALTTPAAFVKLASVIEGLGVSAYLGGAPLIMSKSYLTAAGSILVTEALHQSYERSLVGEVPMANPYGTPLGLNSVYTIASAFITSCPSTNAKLPVTANAALTLVSGLPTSSGHGALVALKTTKSLPSSYFVTFASGLNVISTAPMGTAGGVIMAMVPAGLEGQSYVFLTSVANSTADANVLAGPAIIEVTPDAPTFDLSMQ